MNRNDTEEEYVVLLDDDGNEIGTAPKLATHHAHTPLHKAFSCYVFNDEGKFLVTRRALSKKVWPGVWTNSFCGHPGSGESNEAAIARRADYELGMKVKDLGMLVPDYLYTTPPFNGIIEHELCPTFIAHVASGPQPNPEEVEEYMWMPWQGYLDDITAHPDKYSYWTKDLLPRLASQPEILKYARGNGEGK